MNSTKNTVKELQEVSIDDMVVNGVMSVMNSNQEWAGTMTNLMTTLNKTLGRNGDLPRSPSALRVVLNRVVNRLRCRGVSVKFGRTNDYTRTRYVRFVTR